jgi:hypothetical protein
LTPFWSDADEETDRVEEDDDKISAKKINPGMGFTDQDITNYLNKIRFTGYETKPGDKWTKSLAFINLFCAGSVAVNFCYKIL